MSELQLTQAELEMAERLGVSPEDYQAHKRPEPLAPDEAALEAREMAQKLGVELLKKDGE